MFKKIVLITLFMLFGLYGMSQSTINNYKYVVVPLNYDFLSKNDQYRLNTLTRYLFKQNGFITLFSEEQFPEDLAKDRCKALYVDVQKSKGGFLAVKLEILLRDCFKKEIFKSEVGSSRDKDFKKAYSEALSEAFKSIEQLDYKYQPVEKEVEETKVKNEEEIIIDEPAKEQVIKEEVVVKDEIKVEPKKEKTKNHNELYYAQSTNNGYNLVNTEPKIVMTLLHTAANNIYLVKGKSAIVYKEDGFWYYSENNGELKEKKQLNIKF